MRDGVFDPADVSRLVQAYTDALACTGDGRYDHIPGSLLRKIIARRIILEASLGESDSARLADAALRSLLRPVPVMA